jgi:hypothetical protein
MHLVKKEIGLWKILRWPVANAMLVDRGVGNWECGYFLKYILFRNVLKLYFFILKKLFFISTRQNNLKILKSINLKQKKLIFLKKKFKIQK